MPAPRTLTELFFHAVDTHGNRSVAMRSKPSGVWTALSYQDLLERVQALSLGLGTLGVKPGDRVALLSENRPEWAISDYACLAARCTDVPIYPTLPPKQIEYILRDSGAVAVCLSSRGQLEKIYEIKEHLPGLKNIIAFDHGLGGAGTGVLNLEDVFARGRAARPQHPEWRSDALKVQPQDLATLIYTSGTTGDPKGVMLSHGNINSNVLACVPLIPLTAGEECLSFLPLSHIFERMLGHYTMFYLGIVINYAQSIDTVSADMVDRRPHVVASVPRLYEKIYARVLEGALGGSKLKKHIFFWAKRVGETWAEHALANRPISGGLRLQKKLADRLVFSKLQARTGGRLKVFVSGGAPLSADIARFFHAAGLPILEGYGLTETSPVITVNTPGHVKLGTVGRPIPGVEVKIAPDGEILTRGPHVMQGYFNKPDATKEAIDPEGWFHTGDIGIIDEDGFLKITDRKKDIIVTAAGKNIAPQPIEAMAKTNKFVANAVMLGDKRKFPIMLIVPAIDNLKAWALENKILFSDVNSLIEHPEATAKVEQELRKTLQELAHFEMPKKFLLLAEDFTLESGELTPTLKVKRRVVERKYQKAIDRVYETTPTGDHELAVSG